MSRSKSSKQWLGRHFDDHYVKRAQQEGWRSRAAFKLIEMNKSQRFLKKGMTVVDLGAAPGGWSQVLSRQLDGDAKVFALDILSMDPLPCVEFIQGDFTEQAVFDELMASINGERVDLVLSDMAPNLTGQRHIDQPRAMYLAEIAVDFALQVLKPEGLFIIKLFQGAEFDKYIQNLRESFKKVAIKKPDASRDKSKEVYAFCEGLKVLS